jgi:CRISPR/Cas system-associated exonuclease Cas4 (RecB family)
LAVVSVLIVLAWGLTGSVLARRHEKKWLPPALRDASLAYAERRFFAAKPWPLVARIDRAYRLADGRLVLTELKHRPKARAFPSDIVELSAQRVAIERASGETVSDVAFVVAEHPRSGQRTSIEVQLLDTAQVEQAAARHRLVMAGLATPRKTNVAGLCRGCAFAQHCRPEVLRG